MIGLQQLRKKVREDQGPADRPQREAGAARMALQAHKDDDQYARDQKGRNFFENAHG